MKIRDRIKSLQRVKAGDLLPNPKNWRTHPAAQEDALRGVLAEVGFAGAVLARETPNGLMLIDGHLRAEVAPDAEIPVLVLDVDESEADFILATHDPLTSMAIGNRDNLDSLLSSLEVDSNVLESFVSYDDDDDGKVTLDPVTIKTPPKMTWVLIGVPTIKFGMIANKIEAITNMEETIVEITTNDG